MAEEAIHKKNLATLPTFYGNKEQDSIKPEDLIRRIETNMKATMLNWSDKTAYLYFEMALKGNANEWLFTQKQYTPQTFTAFRNVFLRKYGERLDHTRIYEGYHKMKYRSEQPVERYIYSHTHYHRAITDLGEQEKYKDSIRKATCKAQFDLTNENLVDTFEAGRAYENELLLVSALVSRLPEEIRHKFDDIALGDLTVPKIADKLEIYRNRHLQAKAKVNAGKVEDSSPDEDDEPSIEAVKAKINATKEEDSSPEEDDEPFIEAVAHKKKWTNKKNGFRKFNPSSSNQKYQEQSGTSGAPKKRPFCLHCKKDGHTQDTCFAREREGAPCYSQKGEPYYPRGEKKTSEVSGNVSSVQSVQSDFPY